MIPEYNPYFFPMYPVYFTPIQNKPPTIYTILNTIVNGNIENPDDNYKIKDLAKLGRSKIFDFDYPLTDKISKEKFECMILNHFLSRRIGFETVTNFKLELEVKLNEKMPLYNKMFDSLDGWNIFEDGEKTTKIGTNNRNITAENESTNNTENESETTANSTSDNRYSDTPQNQINDVKDGNYMTEYRLLQDENSGTDKSKSSGTSTGSSETKDLNEYQETITKSPAKKIEIYKELQTGINSIYTMIFNDLEPLFFGII